MLKEIKLMQIKYYPWKSRWINCGRANRQQGGEDGL